MMEYIDGPFCNANCPDSWLMKSKITLPDNLPAKRYRLIIAGEKVYLTITLWQDQPVNICASYPLEWWDSNITLAKSIDALNEQLSIMLKSGASIDDVAKHAAQLGGEPCDYQSNLMGVLNILAKELFSGEHSE